MKIDERTCREREDGAQIHRFNIGADVCMCGKRNAHKYEPVEKKSIAELLKGMRYGKD